MMKNKGILIFLVFVILILSGCTGQEERPPVEYINGGYLNSDSEYLGTIFMKKLVMDPNKMGMTEGYEVYTRTWKQVHFNPDRDCKEIDGSASSAEFKAVEGYRWIEGPAFTFCLEKVE